MMHEWRNVVMIAIGALLVWRAGSASNIELAHEMITIGAVIVAGALGISVPSMFLPQAERNRRETPPMGGKS